MARAEDKLVSELWWVGILEGVAAILFGIAAVFWPGLTFLTLVYLFGAFVLVWGLAEVVNGLLSIGRRGMWWLTLLFGLAGLGVGVYLVRHPGVSFETFILLIGFTLIVRGVVDVVASFLEENTATAKTLSIIGGAAAVIAGVVVLMQPVAGGVAFVWIVGLYALVTGPLMIAMSVDLHRELKALQG